jgi:hypothetical protein
MQGTCDQDECPPHDWMLRCPTCGTEERVTEAGAVDALCWLFTALGHGGQVDNPATWPMHQPTAEKSVTLLRRVGARLVIDVECGCSDV